LIARLLTGREKTYITDQNQTPSGWAQRLHPQNYSNPSQWALINFNIASPCPLLAVSVQTQTMSHTFPLSRIITPSEPPNQGHSSSLREPSSRSRRAVMPTSQASTAKLRSKAGNRSRKEFMRTEARSSCSSGRWAALLLLRYCRRNWETAQRS